VEDRRKITTAFQKRLRRRPARIYGTLVIIYGLAGIVFFALVVQVWAYDIAAENGAKYGEKYDTIYNIEAPAYGFLAVVSLVVSVAGMGLIKGERWAVDAIWICGLIVVVVLWGFFIVRHFLWYVQVAPLSERTEEDVAIPFVVSLVGALFIIIPPLLPSIRR
jgi:uncharacterized membrane protein (UPF0182 family)